MPKTQTLKLPGIIALQTMSDEVRTLLAQYKLEYGGTHSGNICAIIIQYHVLCRVHSKLEADYIALSSSYEALTQKVQALEAALTPFVVREKISNGHE